MQPSWSELKVSVSANPALTLLIVLAYVSSYSLGGLKQGLLMDEI